MAVLLLLWVLSPMIVALSMCRRAEVVNGRCHLVDPWLNYFYYPGAVTAAVVALKVRTVYPSTAFVSHLQLCTIPIIAFETDAVSLCY